jgi:hypothetical protein
MRKNRRFQTGILRNFTGIAPDFANFRKKDSTGDGNSPPLLTAAGAKRFDARVRNA